MDTSTMDGGYVLTDDMNNAARLSSIGGSGFSLLLSLFICLASAWIYSVPSARHHLDRVSFRLLLWSMGLEVVYNITYICLYVEVDPPMANPTSCGVATYILLATMSAANWLCTCIGLNLMLAICFGLNPVRLRLERWYIGISLLIGFGITLIPAALGHFGPDPVYGDCYFTQPDETMRVRDFILDLYLWQILSALIAAGSVLAVLITLLRQSRATGLALFRANDLNITSQDLRSITSTPSALPSSQTHSQAPSWITRTFNRPSTAPPLPLQRQRRASSLNRLQDKFIVIALKISLYPLALIVINGFITASDLIYTLHGGVDSQADYAVYCIYYFLYGGRGMFFALLGIFVDPCLRRGLPAAFKATFRRSRRHAGVGHSGDEEEHLDEQSLSDFLGSTNPQDGEEGAEESGKDRRVWWKATPPSESKDWEVDPICHIDEKDTMSSLISTTPPLAARLAAPTKPRRSITFSAPWSRTSQAPPPSTTTSSSILNRSSGPIQPLPPTSRPALPRSRSTAEAAWVQPLATAVLARTTSNDETSGAALTRVRTVPPLGEVYRRRRELRQAARKMYAEAQAQL